jgi:hypothetical protein
VVLRQRQQAHAVVHSHFLAAARMHAFVKSDRQRRFAPTSDRIYPETVIAISSECQSGSSESQHSRIVLVNPKERLLIWVFCALVLVRTVNRYLIEAVY